MFQCLVRDIGQTVHNILTLTQQKRIYGLALAKCFFVKHDVIISFEDPWVPGFLRRENGRVKAQGFLGLLLKLPGAQHVKPSVGVGVILSEFAVFVFLSELQKICLPWTKLRKTLGLCLFSL